METIVVNGGSDWPVIITAVFTTVAAVGALLTAVVTALEARRRSQPFVAVSFPQVNNNEWAYVFSVKNLGLGPATTLVITVSSTARTSQHMQEPVSHRWRPPSAWSSH